MNIKAQLTLLFDHDGMVVEVHDKDSNMYFLKLRLNRKQTCQVMSRLGHTQCESAEVKGLELVGKKLEMKHVKLRLGDAATVTVTGSKEREATSVVKSWAICSRVHGSVDWEPDLDFDRSSFTYEDNAWYVDATFRRWVEMPPVE